MKFGIISKQKYATAKAKTLSERLEGIVMYVILKLPRFFPYHIGEDKSAAISKQTHIWTPSIRSYIVLALEACIIF